MQSVPKSTSKPNDSASKEKTDLHLNRAENLLKEVMHEQKSGFSLDKAKPVINDKKPADEDAYEEDFDDIEEDLPQNDDAYDQDAVARSANVDKSGQGITVS